MIIDGVGMLEVFEWIFLQILCIFGNFKHLVWFLNSRKSGLL